MSDFNGWGQNGHNLAHTRTILGAPTNMQTTTGRDNFVKVLTSVAMVGGGAYALMTIPGAKTPKAVALGALGGGLLFASLINFYDVVA